ncbi:hypothetical protein RA262_27470, partial [Pseudomonas syringae pv. tagetis]
FGGVLCIWFFVLLGVCFWVLVWVWVVGGVVGLACCGGCGLCVVVGFVLVCVGFFWVWWVCFWVGCGLGVVGVLVGVYGWVVVLVVVLVGWVGLGGGWLVGGVVFVGLVLGGWLLVLVVGLLLLWFCVFFFWWGGFVCFGLCLGCVLCWLLFC